jgi:large subunit ribosomal protein L6
MSRIGKMPVAVPAGVDIAVAGQQVSVKGPKGALARVFPERVRISVDGGVATVTREDDTREARALHGLSRALLANMVTGVSQGFTRQLEIVGVGYRAALKGRDLEMQLGFSHPVPFPAPEGITFEVPEPTKILISGIDKEAVGQVAANIRKIRPPEPYKGKGIRYAGEHIRRKAGKAGRGR